MQSPVSTTFRRVLTLLLFLSIPCVTTLVCVPKPHQKTVAETLRSVLITDTSHLLACMWHELLDDLDYRDSKGIDLEPKLFNGRIGVGYKARWGYKGAGDEELPFDGFTATLTIPVTIADGLIVDPTKATKIKRALRSGGLQRFIEVSASDECNLKLLQLALAVARNAMTVDEFGDELKVLLKRRSVTPSCEALMVEGLRIIGTHDEPGYLDAALSMAPETYEKTVKWLYGAIKAAAPLLGFEDLGAAGTRFFSQLLTELDYKKSSTLTLRHKGESVATVDFGYAGHGNEMTGLQGCMLQLDFPFAPTLNSVIRSVEGNNKAMAIPVTVTLPLGPFPEFVLKCLMLSAGVYRGAIPRLAAMSELEMLIHRVLLTEDADLHFDATAGNFRLVGTEENPGLLRIMGPRLHEIAHYNFEDEEMRSLTPTTATVRALAVVYRTACDFEQASEDGMAALLQTDDGKALLEKFEKAQRAYGEKQSATNEFKLRSASKKVRAAVMANAHDDLQHSVDFAMVELAHCIRHLKQIDLLGGLIGGLPVVNDLRQHGISVNFSHFLRALAGDEPSETISEATPDQSVTA